MEEVLSKKLILVTGKGGIGKSLMAASLAQQAAERGKKVCLVESSAQDQLAPLFGYEPIGHQMTQVSTNISVINLNSQDNFRDFVVLHLGFSKLFERVFTKPIVRSFIQMIPGIAELTLLGRLYFLSEEKQEYDLVIFDGFASGHFLSLLKTPDAVLNSGMVGPVIEETQKVRRFIFDRSKVGVILVTSPEELVISEALDFSQRFIEEVECPISHIAVNRCFSVSQKNSPSPDQITKSKFGLALSYMRERLIAEHKNIDRLVEGLKKMYANLEKNRPQISLLPDLGAIDEPLPAGFSQSWFTSAQITSWS